MHVSRRLVAVMTALCLAVAGCGTDADEASVADPAADGPSTTSGEPAAGDGDPAAGEPVKIVAILDESESLNITYAGARAAMEVRIDRINADGGIGGSGRPVELEICVTELDPNQAAECARQAAQDKDVVATVGSVLGNGDASNPVLEEAGLANLGAVAIAASDGTSEISFPTMLGQIGAVAGMAAVLYDNDFTEVGLLYPDTPGGDQTIPLTNALLATRSTELAKAVQIPSANPDLSPQALAVSDGADGVVLASDPTTAQRLVQTFGQAGVDVQLSASSGQGFTPPVLRELGDAAEGMYLTSFYATDDMPGEGVAEFLEAMEEAGESDVADDLAKNAWVALTLLDELASRVDTIDRASILEAANNLSDFDSGGFTPVIDFTTPGTLLGGAMPRFVNATVVYGQVRDGRVVSIDGEFVDPFVPAE